MAYCAWKLLSFVTVFILLRRTIAQLPGTWQLLVPNAGIASMHTAVTRFNTVILLDRTNIGPSKILLPPHKCRSDQNDPARKKDCHAHSVLLDLATNSIRPLMILTDTWCSSGQFLPDGTLLQTGGDLDGVRKIRKFTPCPESSSLCDWEELEDIELSQGRWYATNQILPDGSVIIVGGRAAPTVEFYPARKEGAINLPFLTQVEDNQMDNLYPYVHLLPDGNLFVFANNKAILYDYTKKHCSQVLPCFRGRPTELPVGRIISHACVDWGLFIGDCCYMRWSKVWGVFKQRD